MPAIGAPQPVTTTAGLSLVYASARRSCSAASSMLDANGSPGNGPYAGRFGYSTGLMLPTKPSASSCTDALIGPYFVCGSVTR